MPLTSEERAAAGLAGELRGAGEGEEAVAAAEPQLSIEVSVETAKPGLTGASTSAEEGHDLTEEDRLLSSTLVGAAVAAVLRSVELDNSAETDVDAVSAQDSGPRNEGKTTTSDTRSFSEEELEVDDTSNGSTANTHQTVDDNASDGGHLCLRVSSGNSTDGRADKLKDVGAVDDEREEEPQGGPDSGHLML